jgi:hypothetical protein
MVCVGYRSFVTLKFLFPIMSIASKRVGFLCVMKPGKLAAVFYAYRTACNAVLDCTLNSNVGQVAAFRRLFVIGMNVFKL